MRHGRKLVLLLTHLRSTLPITFTLVSNPNLACLSLFKSSLLIWGKMLKVLVYFHFL